MNNISCSGKHDTAGFCFVCNRMVGSKAGCFHEHLSKAQLLKTLENEDTFFVTCLDCGLEFRPTGFYFQKPPAALSPCEDAARDPADLRDWPRPSYPPARPCEDAARDQSQEWTPEHLANAFELPAWLQKVCDAHNATLVALRQWKKEAVKVWSDTQYREIAKELDLAAGDEISTAILPGIRKLKVEIAKLKMEKVQKRNEPVYLSEEQKEACSWFARHDGKWTAEYTVWYNLKEFAKEILRLEREKNGRT